MGTEQSIFLLSTLSYFDHSVRSGGVALFYYNVIFLYLDFSHWKDMLVTHIAS